MTYYRCDFANELLQHTKESGHEENYHVECPLCNSRVPCDIFAIHYPECAVKNKNPLKCPYCAWSCKLSRENVLKHKRIVHSYGPFKCGECKHVSKFARGLIEHMIQKHDVSRKIRCPSCKDKLSQEEIESHYEQCCNVKLYKCDKCDMTFKSRDGVNLHIRSLNTSGVSSIAKHAMQRSTMLVTSLVM